MFTLVKTGKCLLGRHGRRLMPACNPSAWEVEAGSLPRIKANLSYKVRPCGEKAEEKGEKQNKTKVSWNFMPRLRNQGVQIR